MATVDLGKIKLVNRNAWSSSETYTADDIVQYTDGAVTSTYICVVASSQGHTPSSSGTTHASWDFLAKGQEALPSQSGQANNALITDGSSLSWGVAGKVIKVTQMTYGTRQGLSSTASRVSMWEPSFTKERANSLLRIHLTIPLGGSGTTYPHFGNTFIRFSTGSHNANGSDIFGYIHNTRATSNNMGAILTGNFYYGTSGTNISAAGTVYVSVGYHSGTSSSSMRPAPIWNPNTNEDNRSRQTISNLVIEEIAS